MKHGIESGYSKYGMLRAKTWRNGVAGMETRTMLRAWCARRVLGVSGGVVAWVCAALFSTPVWAQSLELNLGDKSVEIGFQAPTGWGASGRSQFDGGMLFRDNNPEDYTLAGFGIEVVGDAGLSAPGLQFGVSIKGFYGSLSQIDVGAIAIGGLLRFAPEALPRVYVQISGRYAPNVVTFNDGENMRFTDMRFGYEILPEAEIYLGYRNAEVELESGVEETIDESGFLGLRILF